MDGVQVGTAVGAANDGFLLPLEDFNAELAGHVAHHACGMPVIETGLWQQARQQVIDCRVELDAERADTVPAVFTRINMHFIVTGIGLKESQVKRAVELSAEKYCSASIMLGAAGVAMTHSYEIVEFPVKSDS